MEVANNEAIKLLKRVEEAFHQSDIKKCTEKKGKVWNYYLTSTKLTINTTVLIGFNGGAKGDESYDPTPIPIASFGDLYKKKDELGSFSRVYPMLKEKLKNENVDEFVQLNFCFFRSKKASEISWNDIKLCLPIFEDLIQLLQPQRIIGFSSVLRDYILKNNNYYNLDFKETKIPMAQRSLYVCHGIMNIGKLKRIPFAFLPHPHARITKKAREKAWDFALS